MQSLRSTLRSHAWLAALVMMAGLMLRLMVPAGFMPVAEERGIILVPCSGYGPMNLAPPPSHATTMTDMRGGPHHGYHGASATPMTAGHADHGAGGSQAQQGCAFADLAMPLVAGADPIQLAAAMLFIVVAALFFRAALPIAEARRLRPPLRAPPYPA